MRFVGTLALLALLTACSSDSGTSGAPQQEKSSGGLPSCSEVWVDGALLAVNYLGCTNEDGSTEGGGVECESGTGQFVTHQDRFFALAGGQITEATSDSDAFAAAYHACHVGS
jgi:hypothetical protein